jgi:hypothetical protein
MVEVGAALERVRAVEAAPPSRNRRSAESDAEDVTGSTESGRGAWAAGDSVAASSKRFVPAAAGLARGAQALGAEMFVPAPGLSQSA